VDLGNTLVFTSESGGHRPEAWAAAVTGRSIRLIATKKARMVITQDEGFPERRRLGRPAEPGYGRAGNEVSDGRTTRTRSDARLATAGLQQVDRDAVTHTPDDSLSLRRDDRARQPMAISAGTSAAEPRPP
jgi:hypothetical protein